jgi:hypothetical protein
MGCCFPYIPNIGVIFEREVFGPTTLNQPDEARRLLMSECGLVRQLRNFKVKLASEWEPGLAIWAGWLVVMLSCEVRKCLNARCDPRVRMILSADIIHTGMFRNIL